MNLKTKAAYLFAIALILVFGLASFVSLAKNDNAKSQPKAKSKSKTVNLKNFEKADKLKGTTNAQIHREKVREIVKNLEQVALQEESAGNTEVSDQLEEVVDEQEQTQEETTDAIEEVETRGKIKTFLVGTDYKNLGQLRSSLVHNRNQIRKLTQSLGQVQTPENQAAIEEQLAFLMQERERVQGIIYEKQNTFSLFGWLIRFMGGYEPVVINEEEETQLTNEVEDAIDNTATEVIDATVPPVPPAPGADTPVE